MPQPRRGTSLSCFALAVTLALAGCASQSNNNSMTNTAPSGTIGPNTLNVADAAIAGGDPSMALSVSQSILANDPNNVDALVHEGDAYYALGRCPAAEAAYEDALKSDAKSAAAETGYGRCLLKVDPAGAEVAFLAAVQDDPGNAQALSDLGIARDLQGNFTGAAAAYQQSLMADPGSDATAVNLGLSLALSGQGANALQYLGPLATGPDATPKIREDYAAALVAAGRPDDARQVLAIDMPPDQVDQAMAGFQALIAQAITNPPPPPAPSPTDPEVQTVPVTAVPEVQSAPVSTAPTPLMATASAVPAPAPVTPVPVAEPPPPAAMPAPMPAVSASAAAVPAKPMPAPPPVKVAVKPVPAPAPVPLPAPPKAASDAVPSPAQVAAINPAPEAPAPVPASLPVAMSVSAGRAAVQIAALNTAGAAQSEWRKVSAKAPSLFAGRAPDISKVQVGGQTYYRLRVSGFASHEDAAQFCSRVTAAGGPCMPANF